MADSHAIASWIAARAPAGTGVAVDPIVPTPPFDDSEADATRRAFPKRRDEFHTGRRLARAALAELGCPSTAIPVGTDRLPVWPPGFVGSISHSKGLAVAHVGRAAALLALGIDLERDTPLKSDVTALVCRPEEQGEPLLRFVAKEAFYKAYFPLVGAPLDFQDVRVDLDLANEAFVAIVVNGDKPALAGRRRIAGRVARVSGYVVGAIWVPRD